MIDERIAPPCPPGDKESHSRVPTPIAWRYLVSISDPQIAGTLAVCLDRHPDERLLLAEPIQRLSQDEGFACRRTFPMHVTVGALRHTRSVAVQGRRGRGAGQDALRDR